MIRRLLDWVLDKAPHPYQSPVIHQIAPQDQTYPGVVGGQDNEAEEQRLVREANDRWYE